MNNQENAKQTGSLRSLWIWVTAAFLLLGGAWFALIKVATENAPEPVPLSAEK